MRDLFIALKSLYDATTSASFVASPEWTAAEILTAAQALRTYCVGGIHMPKAPHGTPTPHLTMSATADLTEGSMGYIPREGTVVTFSLWTARYGLDNALLQMKNLCRVFDNQRPKFAGTANTRGIILAVRMKSGMVTELPEPEGGFGVHVDYKYKYK